MIHALYATVLLAAFFAGFGYMQRLASRCPGKRACDGEPRAAGCGACDLARKPGEAVHDA